MRTVVIVSQTTKYRTLWEKAGGSGTCPHILRRTGTDWVKVAQNIEFWTSITK